MTFDPVNHGFTKINFKFQPGDISVYELQCDGVDQTTYDMKRLNVYLSQDGDFVTIWFGLLDAYTTEVDLGLDDHPGIRFKEQYSEDLFRGYIEDDSTAKTILSALRIRSRFSPQALRINSDGQLECYSLRDPEPTSTHVG